MTMTCDCCNVNYLIFYFTVSSCQDFDFFVKLQVVARDVGISHQHPYELLQWDMMDVNARKKGTRYI